MPGRRNDGSLYSGGGSTAPRVRRNDSVDELNKKRVEAKQQQELERRQITDAAEIFDKMIDVERSKTELEILRMVSAGMDNDKVKDIISSLNLYDDSMKKLKKQLQIKLRDPKLEDTNNHERE